MPNDMWERVRVYSAGVRRGPRIASHVTVIHGDIMNMRNALVSLPTDETLSWGAWCMRLRRDHGPVNVGFQFRETGALQGIVIEDEEAAP